MSKARETADLNNGLDVDASGNVGIGTTLPDAGLTVIGDAHLKATSGYSSLYFNGVTTGSSRYAAIKKNFDSPFDLSINASSSGSGAPLIFNSSSTIEAMRIDSSGNVKIPKGKLVDENSTPYQFSHLQNWGGSSNLTHTVGYIGTTGDPTAAYVLLCPAYASTLKYKDFCYGSVFRQRGNPTAGHVSGQAIIQVASAYNANIAGGVRFGTGSMEEFRLCTYNGVRYISLVLSWSSATDISVDLWYSNTSYPPILVDDGAVSDISTLNSLIRTAP